MPKKIFEQALFDAIKNPELCAESRLLHAEEAIKAIVAISSESKEEAEEGGLNAIDDENNTPLNCAAERDHYEIVHLLLKAKANFHIPNNLGRTPLMTATIHSSIKVVGLLLHAGANPICPNLKTGRSPFMNAFMEKNNISIARLFLAKHPEYEHFNIQTGATILFNAVFNESVEGVRLLLTKANPNNPHKITNILPLAMAAIKGNLIIAKMLLEAGADIYLLEESDATMLLTAAVNQSDFLFVYFLLKQGIKASYIGPLLRLLESQDQMDPRVLECLKILHENCDDEYKVSLLPDPMQINAECFINKMTILNHSLGKLYASFFNESIADEHRLPDPVIQLVREYEGRHLEVKSVVKFLEPSTVDFALRATRVDIAKRLNQFPGFFENTIKKIDRVVANVDEELILPSYKA